eukprot:988131-Prymnesium_polylepis.2
MRPPPCSGRESTRRCRASLAAGEDDEGMPTRGPTLHLRRIQCTDCPLASKAPVLNMHVRIGDDSQGEKNEHKQCNANHRHDSFLRRAESEQLVGETGRHVRFGVYLLILQYKHAAQKEADKDNLIAGRHCLVKLAPVRLAHEKRNEKGNGDEESHQQAQELELAVNEIEPADKHNTLSEGEDLPPVAADRCIHQRAVSLCTVKRGHSMHGSSIDLLWDVDTH